MNIKNLTNQLSNARSGIQEKKNISDNVNVLKNTFDQLGPALKEQLEILQTMSPQASTQKEGQEKLLEQKRYFERFLDIINNEYSELLAVCRLALLPPPSREKKTEVAWDKVIYAKDKYISQLKDSLTPDTNYSELMFRLLNLRDSLIGQLIKSWLYRKLLLWKDMAIPNEPFVHASIKSILSIIEGLQNKGQLVPQKPEFKTIEWEQEFQGVWKYGIQNDTALDSLPLPVLLKLQDTVFDEMLESLRNYSNLSSDPQKISQITTNGPQVSSLRGQIEALTQENLKLHQNYNELKLNMKTTDFENIKKLNQRIEELENVLTRKEREITELMSNSKGSLNLISNLREKLKEVEEENRKFNQQFFPKLREAEAQQLKLLDQFSKLKKDIDTYSSLFKLESQMREKALKDKEYAEKQVQQLVEMLGKQKQRTKQVGEIVKQKEAVINKIVESRRESIVGVDSLKSKIQDAENILVAEKLEYAKLTEKLQASEKRYGEMFEINSHFNKRIYELEQQKKQLLDMLKQHNIEPDPTKLTLTD